MSKPTCEQLLEEDGYTEVYSHSDPSWRHGSYMTDVFRDEADGTYWMARYKRSGDGETNELREGLAKIQEVEPYEETVVRYRRKES